MVAPMFAVGASACGNTAIKMTLINDKPLVIAQFSDSHLFAAIDGLHHNVNVFENLNRVLASISANTNIDYAIFTGDLTQDHSEQSYINFAQAVQLANIVIPVFFLAGNHDEPALLTKHLTANPFVSQNQIDCAHWQVQLIHSKSRTPAGLVSEQALKKLPNLLNSNKHQLLMMHHHPVDVGYFIDEHGLQNKTQFWQAITTYNTNHNDNIKAIACGHVHRASRFTVEKGEKTTKTPTSIDVYTCPATSIQFDPKVETVSALAQGPAYRLFYLHQNGTLSSDIVSLQ